MSTRLCPARRPAQTASRRSPGTSFPRRLGDDRQSESGTTPPRATEGLAGRTAMRRTPGRQGDGRRIVRLLCMIPTTPQGHATAKRPSQRPISFGSLRKAAPADAEDLPGRFRKPPTPSVTVQARSPSLKWPRDLALLPTTIADSSDNDTAFGRSCPARNLSRAGPPSRFRGGQVSSHEETGYDDTGPANDSLKSSRRVGKRGTDEPGRPAAPGYGDHGGVGQAVRSAEPGTAQPQQIAHPLSGR